MEGYFIFQPLIRRKISKTTVLFFSTLIVKIIKIFTINVAINTNVEDNYPRSFSYLVPQICYYQYGETSENFQMFMPVYTFWYLRILQQQFCLILQNHFFFHLAKFRYFLISKQCMH